MPSRSQFLATKETVTKKFRPTGPERPAPVVPAFEGSGRAAAG